jgi:hypothetical protein
MLHLLVKERMEENCAEKLTTQLCFNVVKECVWFNVFIKRLPKHVLRSIPKNRRGQAGGHPSLTGRNTNTTFIPRKHGSSLKILGLKKLTLLQFSL